MAVRVGVNLLWCVPGKVGGSEEYLTRQLLGLHELAEGGDAFAGDLHPVVYALPGYAAAHPDVADAIEVVTAPVHGNRRPVRVVAEHSWLAARTRHDDLVHHGGGTVPSIGKGPVVLTVHDLQYLAFPHNFTSIKLAYLRRQMPRSVRRAEVVTAPSEFVRQTVVDAFGVHPERIVVVRHGLEPSVGAAPTPEHVLRDRFGLGRSRVISYVAVTYPHKRHDFLLELLATRWTDPDLKLVLAGGAGLADEAVERRIVELGLSDRVVRPGRVSPDDRDGLIGLSEALVFPSEYEGFGAPLIEAMALGTPIVASDRAAVPEVLGGAGLSLPLELDAWAGALDEVARRRVELVTAGRERVAQFTAARSAGDLLTAYRRAPRMKLAVLCPHFAPDTAPTGEVITRIVTELAARGHELHVVTALPYYLHHRVEPGWQGKLVRRERTEWGSVTRIHPFPGSDKRSIPRRAVGFAAFSALAGIAGLRGGRVDGVLAMSPPLTMGLTGWGVHLVRRGPLVFNIQDVFPDAAIETGAITNPGVIRLARWLERASYRRAGAVTVLSADLGDNVAAKLPAGERRKVRVIPNFVDTEAIVPAPRMTAYRRELGIGDEPVVLYAGNVGFSQSLDLLLVAARELPEVTFLINGGGSARLQVEAEAGGLANVRFGDYQPRQRLAEVLATGDIHVVPLRKGLARSSVPSKTYSVLAAGRPLLASIDAGTEVARVVAEAGCGVAVEPDDPPAFVAALRRLLADPAEAAAMGARGRAWVERWASPAAVAASYDELFSDLTG